MKLRKIYGTYVRALGLLAVLLLCGAVFCANAVAEQNGPDPAANRAAYLEFVQGSLESGFMDEWRGARPMKTMEDINQYLNTFNLWALACHDAQYFNLTTEEARSLATFRQKAVAIQNEAFPKLRDAFGPVLREQIARNKVIGRTIGENTRIADFYGAPFNDVANIRKFHDQIKAVLIKLRFTQADYRTTKTGPARQSIAVSHFADGDMVVWTEDGQYKVVN